MGMSSDGRLLYGYNLQSDSWLIEETGEYGELAVDWYDDEVGDDFIEACQNRLLAAVGITDNPDPDRLYFDREKYVKEHYGVEFVGYGHCDWNGSYALATVDIWAYGYGAETVDLPALVVQAREEGWDDKLRRACEVLGITPKQAKPEWILTSSYG